MSAVEVFKRFVSERLTAAAEEIFGVFEKTLIDYQKEMERQRELLEMVLKPQVKLQKIDQSEGEEDEDLNHQQISSPDQESPGPLHIKEEQEEFFINVEGEPLEPKQEEDNADNSEPNWEVSPLMTNDAQNEEHLPGSAMMAKSQSKHKQYTCRVCGKNYTFKSWLVTHMRTHTGEKPFSCCTCGKRYSQTSHLYVHMRTHTEDKPFFCRTCGKTFSHPSSLNAHVRIHTEEQALF